MTPDQEARLLKLLLLWSAGEITLGAITQRTGKDYYSLRKLIRKHKITKPPRFSY